MAQLEDPGVVELGRQYSLCAGRPTGPNAASMRLGMRRLAGWDQLATSSVGSIRLISHKVARCDGVPLTGSTCTSLISRL